MVKQRLKKAGLDACDFDVVLDAEHENHDHDMAYLYGGVEECGHTHDVHEHNHDEHDHHHDEGGHKHRHGHCCHDHAAEHCHDHEHNHAHRGLAEVLDILNKADLTDRARATAVRIFTILGQAEAKAHGATLETVHFHEVGAVDSIVDITAAAVCLDNLGIEDVIVPVLYEGTGSIRCAHGVLPIPVPAVVNIAAAEHLNLHITDAKGEYVTPPARPLLPPCVPATSCPLNSPFPKLVSAPESGSRNCPAWCEQCSSAPQAASMPRRTSSTSWNPTSTTPPAKRWAT